MSNKQRTNNFHKLDDNEVSNKAMIYSIIPAVIVWLLIIVPIAVIYIVYVEPMEIEGSLKIPEWLVTPAAILIIGLLAFLWKLFVVIFSKKLNKKK